MTDVNAKIETVVNQHDVGLSMKGTRFSRMRIFSRALPSPPFGSVRLFDVFRPGIRRFKISDGQIRVLSGIGGGP